MTLRLACRSVEPASDWKTLNPRIRDVKILVMSGARMERDKGPTRLTNPKSLDAVLYDDFHS